VKGEKEYGLFGLPISNHIIFAPILASSGHTLLLLFGETLFPSAY
jgi:hypothetical protein